LNAAARTRKRSTRLRVYLRETRSPAEAVTRLNAFLCETSNDEEDNAFVAFDGGCRGPRRVGPCRAGRSEAPIIRRANGAIETISAEGMPVGVSAPTEYEEKSLHLHSGDLLLILTDGITEARRGREFFGSDGAERVLREVGALPSLITIGETTVNEGQRLRQRHPPRRRLPPTRPPQLMRI
jgi:serine phosphatase RsbU (regulator of sigma subunit)